MVPSAPEMRNPRRRLGRKEVQHAAERVMPGRCGRGPPCGLDRERQPGRRLRNYASENHEARAEGERVPETGAFHRCSVAEKLRFINDRLWSLLRDYRRGLTAASCGVKAPFDAPSLIA